MRALFRLKREADSLELLSVGLRFAKALWNIILSLLCLLLSFSSFLLELLLICGHVFNLSDILLNLHHHALDVFHLISIENRWLDKLSDGHFCGSSCLSVTLGGCHAKRLEPLFQHFLAAAEGKLCLVEVLKLHMGSTDLENC